jgi:hypothetical protein
MDAKEFKDYTIGMSNIVACVFVVCMICGAWQFLSFVNHQNDIAKENNDKACDWCYDNNISCNQGCADCVTLYRRVYDLKRADFPTYCSAY